MEKKAEGKKHPLESGMIIFTTIKIWCCHHVPDSSVLLYKKATQLLILQVKPY